MRDYLMPARQRRDRRNPRHVRRRFLQVPERPARPPGAEVIIFRRLTFSPLRFRLSLFSNGVAGRRTSLAQSKPSWQTWRLCPRHQNRSAQDPSEVFLILSLKFNGGPGGNQER